MEKQLISGHFCYYQFPPNPGKHFGFNIYSLLDRQDVLLIDTGYEKHAAAVLDDLSANGLVPRRVIISHFHADHIQGLRALPEVVVMGSKDYQRTLDLYTPEEDHHLFAPTEQLSPVSQLIFGEFQLRFLVMPGHAACNVYTIINDRYIHVGDDIMTSNDGEPLLPSVERERIGDHITSLETLKNYAGYTFLLSHGVPLSGEAAILEAIRNRQVYLKAVQQSEERIPYEAAVAGCSCRFLHSEWHEYLYTQAD